MKILTLLLAVLLQAPQAPSLASIRTTLRQLATELNDHKPTMGATPELTTAKHQLLDWVESRLAAQDDRIDTTAFADALHAAIAGADLLCNDCDWNTLGYVDDVRVRRENGFLAITTAVGIACGYDESAYLYAWDGGRWRRVLADERNTYTASGYLPQTVHDVQVSAPGPDQARVVLMLGSQTVCGGAFKSVYARAWTMDPSLRTVRVLDTTERANDEYPPIRGRVRPGDVRFQFTAGGFLSGDVHPAIRRFTIDQQSATPVDPIAGRPRDFVLEWLDAPWEQSRTRAESPALETAHAQLRRTDGVGDFPEPTLRCTGGTDLWQVGTKLYEGPKRYYRVRWQAPYRFTVVDISEKPYPDCTVNDDRGESYSDLLDADLR